MGEQNENITRQTSFKDYFRHITTNYLQGETFQKFLDESGAPYSQQNIEEVFQDDVFKKAIQATWDYQRGDTWPKERTTQTAMSEGILQGLNAITMQVGMREEGINVQQLQGKTDQEVEIIKNTTSLLSAYFHEVLPPSPDHI